MIEHHLSACLCFCLHLASALTTHPDLRNDTETKIRTIAAQRHSTSPVKKKRTVGVSLLLLVSVAVQVGVELEPSVLRVIRCHFP